jgi:hypothetical protein
MRRHRAPFSVLDTFFAVRSWVDCTTSTSGVNLRQAQAELITAVLSAEHIFELARLRDFL